MAGTERDVLEAFAGRYTFRGRTPIFDPDTALDVIGFAQQLSVPILGIDGFAVSETGTQPSTENSVDYSCCSAGVFAAALDFVRSHRAAVTHFEIVFGA